MIAPGPASETIRFPVRGMTCSSCVSRITRAIRKVDGGGRVAVDLRTETATVCREPATASDAALAAAVAEAGYVADLGAAIGVPTVDRPGPLQRLGRFVRRAVGAP